MCSTAAAAVSTGMEFIVLCMPTLPPQPYYYLFSIAILVVADHPYLGYY